MRLLFVCLGNICRTSTRARGTVGEAGGPCGHREADLALLRLFGGVSERAHAAYAEAAPLADGHEERVALWQLVLLLVHAAPFGGSYGPRARQVAERLA